mgnify:CR=1 FL=1
MSISVLQPGAKRTRKKRSPNFPMAGVMKPFGLYPLMAHLVLPGETLNSFNMKWRCLSKPVAHPLAGAWLENWLVYVKLTDLDRDLGNMFIDDTYSTSGYTAASDSERYFTKTGQIDWIKLCCERIHDAYFMDDSETARTIDGVRQTKLSSMSWYQNCIFKPADDALDTTDVLDAYKEMDAYMMMQQMNMSELTYEKYLEQYGVSSVRAAEGDPEILRYSRSWTLPVNTVEPSTGAPSSAWVWSDEMKAEKDKRFNEPGFLICLGSVRPKMYQKHQEFSMVGNQWGFTDWFPAYNLEDPTAGIREMVSTDLVFHADHRTDVGDVNILYDHRDLLSHGEQFVNEWGQTPYALPLATGLLAEDASDNADLRGEYATSTDIDALFSSATSTDKFCFYEGIAHANITGHITDTTPGGR